MPEFVFWEGCDSPTLLSRALPSVCQERMGVEVVGLWHPLSFVLTGHARTNSGFLEAPPVPDDTALFCSNKGTLYQCTSIAGVRRSGHHDAPVVDNFASNEMGGLLDLARRCFWGDCRDHLRGTPAGRLGAKRSGKQNYSPRALAYDDFGSRDKGQKPEEEVLANSYFSMAQSEGRPLVEERPQPDGTVDSAISASFNGALNPPGLGDRTFRLMRRRLASATTPPDEIDNTGAVWGKKEKIREVAESIGHQASGVKIPSSLRDLKRKARARTVESGRDGVSAVGDTSAACCGIKRAFASMVFMIKALQSYTVYMREALLAEGDSQELIYLLSKETHTSFVWFFEQVYSCTPKLMVSLMILLANFTVFSMGSNVASATMLQESSEPLTPTLLDPSVGCADTEVTLLMDHGISPQISANSVPYPYSGPSWRNCAASNLSGSHHSSSVSASGWGIGRSVRVGASHDGSGGLLHQRATFDQGESRNNASPSQFVSSLENDQIHLLAAGEWKLDEEDKAEKGISIATAVAESPAVIKPELKPKGEPSLKQLLNETVKGLELKSGEPYHHVYLDQETIRRLVAPVTVKVEHDDYVCFDRTDLEYQHAISAEPSNPLLLANYAQFLYVVRRKHDSADALFKRAMKADPAEGEVIGRYASFLWLARGDCALAEKAYKAAIAVDPSNPYFAGSYAHFLWHSEGDSTCLINPMT